jgi:4-hydroxyphenylpyruvate dioxygenase-like putative hemolysin
MIDPDHAAGGPVELPGVQHVAFETQALDRSNDEILTAGMDMVSGSGSLL